jgi:catechol 2,3-dioxygenase-like lactoylglutathione lyase family enzyme
MQTIISGIQQIGIGVRDADEAWKWYRKFLGADVPVFQDEAVADLMLPYTDGQSHKRYAILALNMQGGGGFEIWQYKSRTPQPPSFSPHLGDTGLFAAKIKCRNAADTHRFFVEQRQRVLSPVCTDTDGKPYFFAEDPYGNLFQFVESDNWFQKQAGKYTGGTYGALLGVTNIEKTTSFFCDILGYDIVLFDGEKKFQSFANISGGEGKFRRALLSHSQKRQGAFSRLLGDSQIELVQALDRTPRKIFENRLWGDLGLIHLCFDVQGMDALKTRCASLGHPFTVDSGSSFDMGEAAGRFTYIEDPDGTLIEFVETHKVPIFKKIGWYLSLRNRDLTKPLPSWMVKALGLNRKKD